MRRRGARRRRVRPGRPRRSASGPARSVAPSSTPGVEEQRAQRARALRHALAEYELRSTRVAAGPAARARRSSDDAGAVAAERRCPRRPGRGLADASCSSRSWSCAMAWSLDDAGWVLGQRELDRLPALGRRCSASPSASSGAKVGWSRWLAHLVGAVFAALIVPSSSAQRPATTGGGPGARTVATADVVASSAWIDLVVLGLPVTHADRPLPPRPRPALLGRPASSPAYAVFGHRRPLDAVVVVGGDPRRQHGDDGPRPAAVPGPVQPRGAVPADPAPRLRRAGDLGRRRIGDPAAVGRCTSAAATVFIVIAVVGSLCPDRDRLVGAARRRLGGRRSRAARRRRGSSGFLPTRQDNRGIGGRPVRPAARRSRGTWTTDNGLGPDDPARPGDDGRYYWRAVAYDRFDDFGWELDRRRPTSQRAAPGSELLDGSPTIRRPAGPAPESRSRSPRTSFAATTSFSPLTPIAIDATRDAASAPATDALFQAVEIAAAAPYSVTARVPLSATTRTAALTAEPAPGRRDGLPAESSARYTAAARTARRAGGRSSSSTPILTPRPEADGQPVRPRHGDRRRAPVGRASGTTPNVRRTSTAGTAASSSASPVPRRATASTTQHDGGPAARARHPGPARRGLPARRRSTRTGVEQIPNSSGPRVGRGLLPGLRLGHPFDPTGGERSPRRAAADPGAGR